MKLLHLPFEIWQEILRQIQEKAVFYAIAKCSKSLLKAGADIVQKRFFLLSVKHNSSILTRHGTILFTTLGDYFTTSMILDIVYIDVSAAQKKHDFPFMRITSNWNTRTKFDTHCILDASGEHKYGTPSSFQTFFAVEDLFYPCLATYKCHWCGEIIRAGSASLHEMYMIHKKCKCAVKTCERTTNFYINRYSIGSHSPHLEIQEPWYAMYPVL